jgi:hypothetical protein
LVVVSAEVQRDIRGKQVAGISVSAAAGAGFELIGRKPLTVLLWGLLIFVTGVLPLVGIFALVGPTMIDLFRQMAAHPNVPPDPAMFSSMSGLMMLSPLIQLMSILFRAVLCGAVFRAVLTPADSRFAYLRIGMKEIWLAVLFLAEAILAVILCLVAAIRRPLSYRWPSSSSTMPWRRSSLLRPLWRSWAW